jgi:hypothetical protein
METTPTPRRNPIKEFIRRNSAIGHFFLTLALLYVGYLILHAFDPRIGVEGFGDLFGYGMNIAGLTLAIYTSWWFKNHTWRDLHKDEEEDLFKRVNAGDKTAMRMLIWDRIEWVLLMAFFTYWIFH